MTVRENTRLSAIRIIEKSSYWRHNAGIKKALRNFWESWDRNDDFAIDILDAIGFVYGSYVARLAYEAA